MGSWRKVGAFFGLAPEQDEDHHYADGDYPDSYPGEPGGFRTDGYADGGYSSRPTDSSPAGGFADARGSYPAFPVQSPTAGALAMKPEAFTRRDADPAAAGRPATIKLSGFAEARVIGEKYRDGQSVILDMTEMSDSDARRLVDFSAGLAFSLRGSIEKVATKVFMLLPPDADVSAATSYTEAMADARGYAGSFAGR